MWIRRDRSIQLCLGDLASSLIPKPLMQPKGSHEKINVKLCKLMWRKRASFGHGVGVWYRH